MNKWFASEEKDMDIIVSTRIRLARNLSDIPFKDKMTLEDRKLVITKVDNALSKGNFGIEKNLTKINVEQLNDLERINLLERHLVSPDFLKNIVDKALFLSKDNSISIMINEEDHIRIQVLGAGNRLEECYETASMIDDLLNENLKYAFDSDLGFLTYCPTNLGTGMRASVMLHLPFLESTPQFRSLIESLTKIGMTIRGTYGEGSKAVGSYYQLSNQVTLGLTEMSILENISHGVYQIINREHKERSMSKTINLEDKIFRSYGVLKYAKKMSSKELIELSSFLRLGVYFSYLENITYIDVNDFIFEINSVVDDKFDKETIDIKRAKQIKNKLEKIGIERV